MSRLRKPSPVYQVVDSNMLRSPELDSYLADRSNNYAVMPDHVSMEAYKSGSVDSVYASMSILSKYPAQVIVLKSTRTACGLDGSYNSIRADLIDRSQTSGFGGYCRHLELAELGHAGFQRAVLKRVAAAQTDVGVFTISLSQITSERQRIAAAYSKDDLRNLRSTTKPFLSESLKKQFLENTISSAHLLMMAHPEVKAVPRLVGKFPSRYIFRFALCFQISIWRWIAVGSPLNVASEKLVNDMLDLHIATCATYFDGLLSRDEKMQYIYSMSRFILDQIT